jgi:hypothetical protein
MALSLARGARAPRYTTTLQRPFLVGADLDTREEVFLTLTDFLTSYWCVGEIGIGKSNHLLGPLTQALTAPLPVVVFDGAGTLATNLHHAVACFATRRLASADRFPEFRAQAEAFVLRHPLLVFGDAERALSIDLLRRQTLPSGATETLEQVVLRTYQIFNRLFSDDAEKRVRFRRVATSLLTILAAGHRPIREFKELLRGREGFLAFCLTEAERFGLAPSEEHYHREQVQVFLDLQRLPKPTFRTETESTDNALSYFALSPGADYVNEQTLDLPALLASGGKLFLTHVLSDLTLASVLFRAYDSVIRSWIRAREPQRLPTPYGIQVIDEPFWIDSGVSQEWAIQRNKRWSVLLLHQRAEQLETVSPGLGDLMYSYAKLRGQFRPQGRDALKVATELAYQLRTFRPDALQIPYQTTSGTETRGLAEGLARTWSETRSRATTHGSSETVTHADGGSQSTDEGASFDPLDAWMPRSVQRGSGHVQSHGWTNAAGATESETDGTATMGGGQEQTTRSRSTSDGWARQLHFVPVAEQALTAAQEHLHAPEHVLFLSCGGKTRRILLAQQREYPAVLWGVPVGEHARAFQQDVARTALRPRPAFEAGGSVAGGPASPAPSPPPPSTGSSAASPTPSTPRPAAPEPTPTSAPPAPTPTVSIPIPADTTPGAPDPSPTIVAGADGQRLAVGERDLAILAAAADWHFVALDSLRLDPARFGGYSGIADRVHALVAAGLLDRLQPPAPRGTGSLPIYYLLARRGAQLLAAQTGRSESALLRVVENVARTRTAVARQELGQLPHLLTIANVLALASAGAATRPGWRITLTRFDKDVALDVPTAPVDLHLTAALRSRLGLAERAERMVFRPDGVLVVAGAEPDAAPTPLLLEIESGRKETGFEELAHAATLRAYAARSAKVVPTMLAAAGIPATRPFRLLYIAQTAALEARLAVGVTRAIAALRPRDTALVLLTSLDRLHPQIVPSSRGERAASLREKATRFFAPVWRTAASDERIPLFP